MKQRLYQKLIVWQQAHGLCLEIYKVTKLFPECERWRLIDQICRASASVPTNIAEGNSKTSQKEKRNFLGIAEGSLDELHYHCLLARDLHYITPQKFLELEQSINSIGYLLSQLRNSLTT